MPHVKAYAAFDPKAPLAPYAFDRREPRDTDVEIDIHYCGICHSDIHQARNEWGGANYPMVPGHEIAGVVSRVGKSVRGFAPGDHVGVGPMVDSCRECARCKRGLAQYCDKGFIGAYNSLERDGKTMTQGGYSTQIVVDHEYVVKVPHNLPLDRAAPLLCAGVTLYSPLKHWKAGPGKKVAIIGLGGLGHMGVKIAHAMGAEVTVLSHSLKKSDDARRLGADHFYVTSGPEGAATFKKLENTFDLIINTVSAKLDWTPYIGLLDIEGTLVVVGVPEEDMPLGSFSLIAGRRSVAGSLVGSIRDTQEMLDFCGKHGITCDIELIPASKINDAYERVLKSDVRYRFVIDAATLK